MEAPRTPFTITVITPCKRYTTPYRYLHVRATGRRHFQMQFNHIYNINIGLILPVIDVFTFYQSISGKKTTCYY
jgi:hypothetical protein